MVKHTKQFILNFLICICQCLLCGFAWLLPLICPWLLTAACVLPEPVCCHLVSLTLTPAFSVVWLFMIESSVPLWHCEFSWRGPIIIHFRVLGITGHTNGKIISQTIIINIIYEKILSVQNLFWHIICAAQLGELAQSLHCGFTNSWCQFHLIK